MRRQRVSFIVLLEHIVILKNGGGVNLYNNFNRDIYTLVILTVGTFWGVFVKYIAYLKKSKEEFSFLILMSEFFAHGFVGFLAFFVCMGLGINANLAIGISLFFAFVGLKLFIKIESEILEGLDGLSEKIKRWLR